MIKSLKYFLSDLSKPIVYVDSEFVNTIIMKFIVNLIKPSFKNAQTINGKIKFIIRHVAHGNITFFKNNVGEIFNRCFKK